MDLPQVAPRIILTEGTTMSTCAQNSVLSRFRTVAILAALCAILTLCIATVPQAHADEGNPEIVPYAYIDDLIHLYDEASAFPGEKVNVTYHTYTFQQGYYTLEPTWLGYEDYGFSLVTNRYGVIYGTVWTDLTHYLANYAFY